MHLQTCLRAGHTAPSLLQPILAQPLAQISTALCPDLSYNDNLVYHYTGGIVFGLWKDWSMACVNPLFTALAVKDRG
jgi:COP9 signalosome complex subunit 3